MSIEQTMRQKLFTLINKGRGANDNINDVWAKSITRRVLLNRTVVFLSIGIMLYSLSTGKMTTGTILLVILYLQQIQSNLMFFSRYLTATAQNESRATRLVQFLETKPGFDDNPEAAELEQLQSIEFDKVTFDYKGGKRGAVKNISFSLYAGKTVALVGPSGVGKSTLTKLLLRFYEPTKGDITINKQDASAYTAESIRQHIGMVMQDVALFNATILENLQIANANATESQIIAAARQAHAHEFIRELPKGYKTLVGERGVKLSGGQKQRVAIARAILKNPQLIVLDEATSALDSESERLVQDGLQQLMQGRSALIIAHRLSTVMHADEILVLQKGTIVERGNHAKLIRYNGLYKKLFEMQSASGKIKL
jgi:ABC-type multidrug transport system fused ATPase/permease subunit